MEESLKLTVAEAIKQGYTHFGAANEVWQNMRSLHTDIDEHTFSLGKFVYSKRTARAM